MMTKMWVFIALVSGAIASGAGCGAQAPAQENLSQQKQAAQPAVEIPVAEKAPQAKPAGKAPAHETSAVKGPSPTRPIAPAKPQPLAKPTPVETAPAPAPTQVVGAKACKTAELMLETKVALDLTNRPLSEFIADIKKQSGLEVRISPDAFTSKDDGKPGPKPAQSPADKPLEIGPKPADKLPERPSDKSGDKPTPKPAEKPSTTPPVKPADRSVEKRTAAPAATPVAKPIENVRTAADAAAQKPADKAPEKPADKAAEKPAEQPAEKATEPSASNSAPTAADNEKALSPASEASPDDGNPLDPIVSAHLKGVTTASALNLVLRDVGLTWTIDHGSILIAAPDQLPSRTAVYDVRDLVVAHPGFDNHDDSVELDYDSLVNLITGVIQTPAWSGDVDKVQDCNPFHGTLTVRQDHQTQEKVAGLLAALRRARDLHSSQYTATANLGFSIVGADDSVVEAALDANVDANFKGEKLDDMAEWVRHNCGIPVHVDATVPQSVEEDRPLTIKASGVSLRTLLKTILPPAKLAFSVADETLVISSQDAAADLRSVRVYPVGDMISGDVDQHGIDDDYGQLLDSITHNVEPDSWATLDRQQKPTNSGGNAYAAYLASARAIVFDQTSTGHAEIAATLAKLRAAVATQPATKSQVVPTKSDGAPVKKYLSMRIYKLNPDLTADDFVAVVHDLVEPKSWSGEAYLHGVPGAIVVRNTPAVHKRVERLLIELGAIPDPKKNGQSGTPILVGRQKRI